MSALTKEQIEDWQANLGSYGAGIDDYWIPTTESFAALCNMALRSLEPQFNKVTDAIEMLPQESNVLVAKLREALLQECSDVEVDRDYVEAAINRITYHLGSSRRASRGANRSSNG